MLSEYDKKKNWLVGSIVLILVVMDNALRACVRKYNYDSMYEFGLNPCFNGKCSQRAENKSDYLSVT